MRILVVGSGGREHALAWRLSRSELATHVFVAPGNPGTDAEPQCTNVPIAADDLPRLVAFAQTEGIKLAVIGPERPLALGLADALRAAGVPTFGPSPQAARLETSKRFTKALLDECGIPTAPWQAFDTLDAALAHARTADAPLVVKADGLAGGKGVTVADTHEATERAIADHLTHRRCGPASSHIVLEERLTGPEVSLIALVSHTQALPLALARDHKRLRDGDQGPNTGGMGAVAPPPDTDNALRDRLCAAFIQPAIEALAARNTPFIGFLYAGLILTPDGPRLLEYNVRCGDPEAQALLFGLSDDFDDDLLPLLHDAALGRLTPRPPLTHTPAACVVLAEGGYPGHVRPGHRITGLDQLDPADPDLKIFHAGTRRAHRDLLTAGGRVLGVTARAATLDAALERAYSATSQLSFDGMHYRRDIGRHTP